MRRTIAVLVALSVVLPAVAATGAGQEGGEANVTISSTAASPETPFVDESVTVTPTISNGGNSPTNVEIDAVSLRTDGGRQLGRVEDLGRLPPGASTSVQLDARFGDAGSKQLRVIAYGEDGNGNDVRLESTVSIRVRDDHPDVRIAAPNATVAGLDGDVRVRVDNGFDRELRSVDVRLRSSDVDFRPWNDGQPRLAGGESAAFEFTARTREARTHRVEAVVSYRTTTGHQRSVTAQTGIRFEALEEDVTVDAPEPPRGNTSVPVTVGNFGNAPLENVVVRATATNGSVAPVTIDRIPPDETRRVRLDVAGVDASAELEITAAYDLGDRTGTATATSRVVATPDVPGQIQLTGLEVRREGGRYRITGSASNVGLRSVNSVIVRVRDTEQVTPAAPNREYFVGTVPSSDFVSFDLHATTSGNVTSIPLEVSYLADGDRRTVEASAPVESVPDERVRSDAGGGGPGLLVFGVGLLAALAVGALVYVGWRNRGD